MTAERMPSVSDLDSPLSILGAQTLGDGQQLRCFETKWTITGACNKASPNRWDREPVDVENPLKIRSRGQHLFAAIDMSCNRFAGFLIAFVIQHDCQWSIRGRTVRLQPNARCAESIGKIEAVRDGLDRHPLSVADPPRICQRGGRIARNFLQLFSLGGGQFFPSVFVGRRSADRLIVTASFLRDWQWSDCRLERLWLVILEF